MKVDFRAKTINQDYTKETEVLKNIDGDWYAIGKEQTPTVEYFNGVKLCAIETYPCDYSTRSINFEDMLDSKNNPIFASFSESGKGGDVCEFESVWNCKVNAKGLCIYFDREIILKIINRDELKIMTPYS